MSEQPYAKFWHGFWWTLCVLNLAAYFIATFAHLSPDARISFAFGAGVFWVASRTDER